MNYIIIFLLPTQLLLLFTQCVNSLSFCLQILLFFFFEKEREQVGGGSLPTEWETERESEAGSMSSTEPNTGLSLNDPESMT